jgi:hypothetical protein
MPRTTAHIDDGERQKIDHFTLDDAVASILVAIEQETIPERLLTLATDLQKALMQQRQRQKPN